MRDAYVMAQGRRRSAQCPTSYRSLFTAAFERAVDSVPEGIDEDDIDEAVIGSLGVGGRQLGLSGPAATEHAGLHGIPSSVSRTPVRPRATRSDRPSRR